MLGEIPLYAEGVHPAAGLLLQILVSPDMVGVGVGVVYGLQLPAVGVQDLPGLFPGVLVAAAVYQHGAVRPGAHQPYLGRALNVIGALRYLYQFVHFASLQRRI